MRFEALLERRFPLVIGLFIAIAAYFQARGFAYLAEAALYEASPVDGPSAPPFPEEKAEARPNGDAILRRNPFDSITGPLVRPEEPPPADPADPFSDPRCPMGAVTLIVWAEGEPEWSFAAIVGPDGSARLHRKGDAITAEVSVAFIGSDRVWLEKKNEGLCQLEVHDLERARAGQPGGPGGPSMPPPPQEAPRARPPSRGDTLPPQIAERIRQVGPNQYEIDRTAVDAILSQQAELLRRVRILPAREGDRTTGMRLLGIRPGTLLDAIGLKHGDQLQSINGYEMTNPQNALEAYARLASASKIRVDVMRRGQPTTVELDIK